jgi:hypothetical protein
MSKKLLFGLAASVALFVSQCTENPSTVNQQADNEVRSFSNLSSDVLIDLPSSISSQLSAGVSKVLLVNDPARDIYNGIRDYIGFANFIVNNDTYGVKAVISFWRDTLNWHYVKQVGTVSGTTGNCTWTASYDSTAELTYKLTVTKNDVPGNPLALSIDFNGRSVMPKGKVYYNVGLFEKSVNDSLKIEVTFDRQAGNKSLNIKVTGCDIKNDDDPLNIDLSLYAKNGYIHVSGSSYHPNIDSVISGVKGHCYTFTGIADPALDKSVISLGLPPSGYAKNDSTIFKAYGVAEMWTSALIQREIPALPDTIKSLIATSYSKNLSLEQIYLKSLLEGVSNVLLPASAISTITAEQFTQFLTLNESVSNIALRVQINSLLWIAELTQPVYFNDGGYFGNGNNVPSGFNYLTEIKNVLEIKTPSVTASLKIVP